MTRGMNVQNWRKELRSRLMVIVSGVDQEIETGEPFNQPEPHALAASLDCQRANELLTEEDISDDSIAIILATIRQAAGYNRSDRSGQEWLETADRLEKGWLQGDFARGIFPAVSASAQKEIDTALLLIEMEESFYGHLTKEERATEKARNRAEADAEIAQIDAFLKATNYGQFGGVA